jgi:hypothetical protein
VPHSRSGLGTCVDLYLFRLQLREFLSGLVKMIADSFLENTDEEEKCFHG